jgi:hypothetical protein
VPKNPEIQDDSQKRDLVTHCPLTLAYLSVVPLFSRLSDLVTVFDRIASSDGIRDFVFSTAVPDGHVPGR